MYPGATRLTLLHNADDKQPDQYCHYNATGGLAHGITVPSCLVPLQVSWDILWILRYFV